eukprot:TRINITY_DN33498_c0_g1_i1.p1 TRINITY_DN33498_c0_g1~~TRINITY_DN33498_c0_g1_i1.p1  ORF type:complete len:554 (+),score=106.37 TRINITY_DN33498_c0_g1_i1:56-1663(+)
MPQRLAASPPKAEIGPAMPPGIGRSSPPNDEIGPIVPPSIGATMDIVSPKKRKQKALDASTFGAQPGPASATSACMGMHSRGAALPSSCASGSIRRASIGPAPRPMTMAPGIAFTEVYEAPRTDIRSSSSVASNPCAPDTKAVALCRRGELPPSGWSSKWSSATKHAALIAALEESQMHVVYALRPHSAVWQDSVQAVHLEQAELDRLLREKVSVKPRPSQKQKVKEAMQWLLEAGASLESLCADNNFDVRAAAAGILADLGAEAGGAKAAALLKSDDWQARATAAEALGRLGREAVAHGQALAALLGDSETPVRMAATAAFGKLGAGAAVHCVAALESRKAREREAACEALGLMGPAAAEHGTALAELLQDCDWQVPTAAANALKRLGPTATVHCATVLGRCSQMARSAVAEAIVRLGGAAAAESLVPLLRSQDEGVRKYAAECLGQLGSDARPFVRFLLPLKEDNDREVKRAANHALVKLGLGPGLPQDIGNGDDMPPPPEGFGHKGKGDGKGRSKGERRRSDRSRSRSRRRR